MAQQKQKGPKKRRPSNRDENTNKQRDIGVFESDSTYLLKLVVFVLLGTLWLKFKQPIVWLGVPLSGLPAGLLIGLIFANLFEKYQSDRKIWYAILIIVTIICYFVPAGIVI